jgi:outer membrane protein assembly factor BamB
MRTHGIAAVALVLVLAGQVSADWPQFLGPNRNGCLPDAKIPQSWPQGGPKVLWTVPLGEGFGGPSIQGGKVYVLDRINNAQEVLRCLNLSDGKEQWKFSYEAPGKFSYNGSRQVPTVGSMHVFSIGAFGHLYCVDKTTHRLAWNKNLLQEYGGKRPKWAVAQAPVLYKDLVIVAPLGKSAGVVAFRQATGETVWKSQPLGKMEYSSPFVTTVGGVEQIVMLSQQARISGVDIKTGKILWTYGKYKCSIPIAPPTPIGDGRFFLTEGYNAGSAMFKVEKNGGGFSVSELFREKALGSQTHPAILYKDHLYLCCNTNNKHDGLVCMNLQGNVKWKTDKSPNFDRGNSILLGDVMLIMEGRKGTLHMVKPGPAGYKEITRAQVLKGPKVWAPMAYSDGRLVCRDQRQMKCLSLK